MDGMTAFRGHGGAIRERLSNASQLRKEDQTARQYRQFVKGPIPMGWLERAAALPGKAFTVGVLLWFKSGVGGGGPFTVPNKTLARFKVGRKAAYRAYEALSAARLIQLDRGPGKLPRVKILVACG